jgi:hypothetical protein
MMNNCLSKILTKTGTIQEPIFRKQGVFQGSILSPFLFNIFIDKLARDINKNIKEPLALFFADDIVLKTKNIAETQKLIFICEKWANDNGLSFGIKKCGIMGSGEKTILIQGEPIPTVKCYKYLGLPHMLNGINWGLYCSQVSSKVTKFIQSLQYRKKTWNFQSRITIYKTFIRPIGEYCLPIITNWIKSDPKARQKYYDMLEKAHTVSLEWIFDSIRPKKVLEYISGLSLDRRIIQLEGSLSRHLQALDHSNPLIIHYQSNFLSTSTHFILGRCFKNEKFEKWKKLKRDDSFEMTWETCCKQDWVKNLKQSSGILHHYILPCASKYSIKDYFLTTKLQDAEKMLKWRCNTSFTRSVCPKCLKHFTRAHLNRCSLYSLLPEKDKYEKLENNKEFLEDVKKIEKDLEKYKKKNQFSYTLLDYFLNHGMFDEFISIYSQLWSLFHAENTK